MSRLRLRAPELVGRGWLNTGGRDLTLQDLRGRVVVLDFWTFCCVNCLHVLDELRPLEDRYGDSVVVVGVHSPKFVHEADPQALADAVERYGVHHPVLDDPDLVTWQAYGARAWPTLVVIDPQGYIVASMSGEGHAHGIATLVEELLQTHADELRTGDSPYVPPPAPTTALRFPGKAVALPDGSLLVTDTAHHEVAWLEADLLTERARYGGFGEPQGIALVPSGHPLADGPGCDVVVADALHHRVYGLSLGAGEVTTLAGTGRQLRERTGGGPATEQDLSTPWDLAFWGDDLVVAMAGTHQLWVLRDGEVHVAAGTSAEGVRDGAGEQAWFAQPSGLAVGDEALYVADSETSALRRVTRDGEGVQVQTLAGQGLFDFGHRDGPAGEALFQHPLGVRALPDGSVLVADTYNGALRRYADGHVSTVATGLAEPSDVVLRGEEVLVVESAAHRVVPVDIGEVAHAGFAHRTQRPPTPLAAGRVVLRVAFEAPAGQKLDDRWGDPTQLMVSATPAALLRAGSGTAPGLERSLEIDPAVGEGVLHVSVRAAACDVDDEHAACHLYQQDWGVPVVVEPGAPPLLDLDLRAV